MTNTRKSFINRIQSIVGIEHVTESPSITIGAISPILLVRPGTSEEICSCLKVCSEEEVSVVPAGKLSWINCGNPLRSADVLLSLERLDRVVEYSPADLTISVEAGVTLASLNQRALKERQWLPIDPPCSESSTVGGLVACNSSGALRPGYGTPRDYVIGLKLAHADGSHSKAGGKVVKNVAGYDMNKLYIGSYGTLAVITGVTFKLRPLAERDASVMFTSKYRGPLFQLSRRILSSELQPASVVLCRRIAGLPEDALIVRFIDNNAAVTSQIDWAISEGSNTGCAGSIVADDEARSIWSAIQDFDQHLIRVRFSVPVATVPAEFEKAFLAHLECAATADVATGIIRVGFDTDERLAGEQIRRLRANATAAGGSWFIEKSTPGLAGLPDAFGDAAPEFALIRMLKQRFDPQSILSPGRFIGGI